MTVLGWGDGWGAAIQIVGLRGMFGLYELGLEGWAGPLRSGGWSDSIGPLPDRLLLVLTM